MAEKNKKQAIEKDWAFLSKLLGKDKPKEKNEGAV
jgi:hypothetical protein